MRRASADPVARRTQWQRSTFIGTASGRVVNAYPTQQRTYKPLSAEAPSGPVWWWAAEDAGVAAGSLVTHLNARIGPPLTVVSAYGPLMLESYGLGWPAADLTQPKYLSTADSVWSTTFDGFTVFSVVYAYPALGNPGVGEALFRLGDDEGSIGVDVVWDAADYQLDALNHITINAVEVYHRGNTDESYSTAAWTETIDEWRMGALTLGQTHVIEITHTAGAAFAVVRVDGAPLPLTYTTTDSVAPGLTTLQSASVFAHPYADQLELLFYRRALSDEAAAPVRAMLAARYGVPA